MKQSCSNISSPAKQSLILSAIMVILAGCNGVGSGQNPSISAAVIGTPSTCTGLKNLGQCTIQITYNTNGVSGVTLGTSPTSLPASITTNPSFSYGLTNCQNQVVNNSSGPTCSMTITYTSPSNGGTNVNLAFTLGSTTSNAIQVTGN